jgi:tight adherence protein C
VTLAVLAGVGFGAALWLLGSGLFAAPEPLPRALARLDQARSRRPTRSRIGGVQRDVDAWLGGWLRRNPTVEGVVDRLGADLRVLHRSPDEETARLVVYGLVGLLWAPLVSAGAWLLGVRVPVVLTVWSAAAGAVIMAAVPYQQVRKQATAARSAFGHALSAFCDVAGMAMSAGQEVHGALLEAAAAGDGWSFDELSQTLHAGFLAGERPWESLTRLGRELGIEDLVDLGGTIALAEEEGAPVIDTVASKARSIRERLVAATERDAAAATERMALPGAMLMFGFLAFIAYPAIALILQEAN